MAEDPVDALARSLVPGTSVERYGRTWRMGRWRWDDSAIVGRIGFEEEPGVTELWNREVSDFEERALPSGVTSPFAIQAPDLRVAFQLRPGKIRPTTFTGALQALLNRASPFWSWRVEREVIEMPWETWLGRVTRITHLSVTLRRPNPHYGDREYVERLIEGVRARVFTGDWKARPDDPGGIDLGDEIIREAIEHASEYGKWSAAGEIDPTAPDADLLAADEYGETRWRSGETALTPSAESETDPATGEARPEALRDILERRSRESRDDSAES
jgi:hypothetical protein